MAAESDIIQLNGKRYDARTGHLLTIPGAKKYPKKGESKKIPVTHQASSDKPHVHHRTERAKTLMRQAVKKPSAARKIELKSSAGPKIHRQQQSDRIQLDPERLARAQQIAKSHLIHKFGRTSNATSAIRFITTELPVQPEPIPVSSQPEEDPLPETDAHTTESVWQHAIDRATSHTEPRAKRVGHRHRLSQKLGVSTNLVNISAVSLSVILLAGFMMYQNVPSLSMQRAAERAGVAGSLPEYQPAGFGLSGPIQYRPGQITLNFESHSDNRKFQIQQRKSDLDDVALVKDYLVPNHAAFQMRQAGGKTIYIYNNHNATWLDNGTWYQVDGTSSQLNSDQLVRLAASM